MKTQKKTTGQLNQRRYNLCRCHPKKHSGPRASMMRMMMENHKIIAYGAAKLNLRKPKIVKENLSKLSQFKCPNTDIYLQVFLVILFIAINIYQRYATNRKYQNSNDFIKAPIRNAAMIISSSIGGGTKELLVSTESYDLLLKILYLLC